MKILLFDTFERKIFDLFNILREVYNDDIIICSFNNNYSSSFFSKLIYNRKIHYVDKKLFVSSLDDILEKFPDDEIILFPTEEKTMIFFYEHRNNLNKRLKYIFPNRDVFNLVREKKTLNDFCLSINIPVPKEYNVDEISEFVNHLPLIAKPKIGSGSRGIFNLNSNDDIVNFEIKVTNKKDYLVQEKIANGLNVEGCFLLCRNGEIINYYTHTRIRTFPRIGGVTTHSKVSKNIKLFNASKKLILKLNYSGLLMIEFLYDKKDNNYKLIEINPRIWGSILASKTSNINLIHNYISLCTNKDLSISDYKESYITWFFPYELTYFFTHFISRLKQRKLYSFINISNAKIFNSFIFHIYVYTKKALKKLRFVRF
jgi:predicted ATP-grasp superfamily ATP-dependent carboligase